MAFSENQGEQYLWDSLKAAVNRLDLEAVLYWQSQLLIHRHRKVHEIPVIR